MKLFGKQFGKNKTENSDVPADLQQYYDTGGSSIGKWILRIVLFLVVLGLLIWGGIWLFGQLTGGNGEGTGNNQASNGRQEETRSDSRDQTDKKDADSTKQDGAATGSGTTDDKKKGEATNGGSTSGAGAGTTGTSDSDTSGTATTPEPKPAPAPATTSELPNSGPGTMIAGLFAAVSALGAALHSLYLRRSR